MTVADGKESKLMTTEMTYADEPLGEIKIIRDFLPTPAELAAGEEGLNVPLDSGKSDFELLKSGASKS
jgi:hypothetical protein